MNLSEFAQLPPRRRPDVSPIKPQWKMRYKWVKRGISVEMNYMLGWERSRTKTYHRIDDCILMQRSTEIEDGFRSSKHRR